MIEYKSYKLRLSGINVYGRDLRYCISLSPSFSLFLLPPLRSPVIDALFPHPPSNTEAKIHLRRSRFIPRDLERHSLSFSLRSRVSILSSISYTLPAIAIAIIDFAAANVRRDPKTLRYAIFRPDITRTRRKVHVLS